MIHIIGPKDKRNSSMVVVNTTSCSKNWSRGLSPFFLGPVNLYDNYISQNVENGWQYSKCYKCHVDEFTNTPNKEYFQWAKAGWESKRAERYPMGKGVLPKFSWWNGKAMSYVEARKKIYIPLYAEAVQKSDAFKMLQDISVKEKDIWLWDFDGYDHIKLGMTDKEAVNCDSRKMGHAFVLKFLLENSIKTVAS